MAITGIMPFRHNGDYDPLLSGSVSEKIGQVRETAKKKEWQEDRLARVRLEDWLFTVRS